MQELRVINDDVMGGRSRSKLMPTATGLLFEGEVSLSNGGSGTAQYQAPFVAPRTWTILRFVSGDFVARFRGRLVIAPPLQLADVRAFGLLIGEGQSGPFRAELELPRAG
jgi:hypothetical protein